MMPRAGHPLQLALGLTLWSLWFVCLYAGLSIGCIYFPPSPGLNAVNWLNGALGLLSLLTFGLLLSLAWHCWRDRHSLTTSPERFVARVGAAQHLLAALATLFIAVPLLRLPPCL